MTAILSPTDRVITQQQADDIVRLLHYDDVTEESEVFAAEREYRYFLIGDLVLVIRFDGRAEMRDTEGTVLNRAFVDCQTTENAIHYWVGGRNVGTHRFS